MRVTQDKCESLLDNTGELICMLKSNIYTDLCCQKQPLKMINSM